MGGYRDLKSFQGTEIIFDLTVEFLSRYIKNNRKLWEQMEGAARSGKQNLAEGSKYMNTSRASEIRLIEVNRGSLEELLLDYEDCLRKNHLPIWSMQDHRVTKIRKLAYAPNKSYKTYLSYLENLETAANCLITIINQTNYLLDRQMRSLKTDVIEKGDMRERLSQERNAFKKTQLANPGPSLDEFLKGFGMKRLENGQVIKIEEYDSKKQ